MDQSTERFMEWEKEKLSNEVGKFILCEAKEDNTTRLFIHKFHSTSSLFTKNGWWDTFTLSTKPCAKGFYLCSIQNVKTDKNGYVNLIVYPNKFLGITVNEDSIAWDYFFFTGLFSSEYKTRHNRQRFNTDKLERTYAEAYKKSGHQYIEDYIFSEYMDNKISMEEIAKLLEEKLDIEILSKDINENIQKYADKYPLLVKKLPKDNFYGGERYTVSCTVEYLKRKSFEYVTLQLGNETSLLDCVEAVLKHWADIHEAQKKEKRNKRKKEKGN